MTKFKQGHLRGTFYEVNQNYSSTLVGLVVTNATAKQEVMSLTPMSDIMLLCFSIRNLLVAATKVGFVPG